MQVFTSITDFKKRAKEKVFYSKVGFAISGGVFHTGLEEVLRSMAKECDYRILLLRPTSDISDDFEDKIKPFNLDCIVLMSSEDLEFFEARTFSLKSVYDWVDLEFAFFFMQMVSIFKFNKFYTGQKDFYEAKIISELIHDFNLDIELEVVANIREKNGVLCSSNFTKFGNFSDQEYQILNKAIDFTLRMIQNGQKDVMMLEKLIQEYVSEFKKFRLQKVTFLDAVNLTEIGFIDGNRKIFFQLEGQVNSKKFFDNVII